MNIPPVAPRFGQLILEKNSIDQVFGGVTSNAFKNVAKEPGVKALIETLEEWPQGRDFWIKAEKGEREHDESNHKLLIAFPRRHQPPKHEDYQAVEPRANDFTVMPPGNGDRAREIVLLGISSQLNALKKSIGKLVK